MQSSDTAIAQWVDKMHIATTLAAHSRGVDRADANLLRFAYHPDASVDYGFFSGSAGELAVVLAQAQRASPVTQHCTCNGWIRIDGATAVSESYVLAYAEQRVSSTGVQRLIGGRYLDSHEKRDGVWRLSHRRYVMDFNINRPSTAASRDPAVALSNFVPMGGHGAADPGRALLALHAATFPTSEISSVNNPSDLQIDQALSKQTLHELNTAYARAADRADSALMAAVFHEDATVVTGVFNGRAQEYAVWVTTFLRDNLQRSFHFVANEWFEVTGDRAVGESYVIAYATAAGTDTLTGGRYIDSFERRKGLWKIKARTFVVDWTSTQPTSGETGGMYETLKTRGCFGRDDPVYALWGD